MAVSTLIVRALIEGIEPLGVERAAFLERAAFDGSRLSDAEGRVSAEEYDALVRLALATTGNDALGLHMGETASTMAYSLTAHLVAHAPTLRAAIEALGKHHRLLDDGAVYRLREAGSTATLACELAAGSTLCRRFGAELTMTGLVRMLSYFARGARPQEVCFEHPAPPYVAEYARIFEGRERFGRPATSMVFERSLLDLPHLHADPELYRVLEAQAQRRILRQTSAASFGDRVLDYLVERDGSGERHMSEAARALGLSVRSLRRRLEEKGVTFNEILGRAQAIRARQLLGETDRTIDDVAAALGFSDRRAFHRAFKRWTGTTPKEYRLGSVRGGG